MNKTYIFHINVMELCHLMTKYCVLLSQYFNAMIVCNGPQYNNNIIHRTTWIPIITTAF